MGFLVIDSQMARAYTAFMPRDLVIDQPWTDPVNKASVYERETFENGTQLLPELQIFGWLRFRVTATGFLKAGRHPGAFEIHYLRRGHLKWWVEDTQYEFSPGSIFVIAPDELHGGDEGSLQPCEHFWLRISFPARGALPGLSPAQTARLRSGFEDLRYRLFPARSEVEDFFEMLLHEHRDAGDDSVLVARSLLHALLSLILRDHVRYASVAQEQAGPLLSRRIRQAVKMIEENIGTPGFRCDEVAGDIGLSEAGLRSRFKTETGYTPTEYIAHRRIEESRRRLAETNDDVTRIAMDLGFSSSQYFATVFRKKVGLSPGMYRETHRS